MRYRDSLLNCSVPAVSNISNIHWRPYLKSAGADSDQELSVPYIDFDLLPIRVFYCWIVAFYPHILYKLRCRCTSASASFFFARPTMQRTGKTTFPNATCSVLVSISRQGRSVRSLPAPRTTMWYSRLVHLVSYDPASAAPASFTLKTLCRSFLLPLHTVFSDCTALVRRGTSPFENSSCFV